MEVGEGGGARVPDSVSAAQNQQDLIESFCAITSSSPEEAAFFLECHNWNLEAAIHSFYDADGEGQGTGADGPSAPRPRRRADDTDDVDADVDNDDGSDKDYVPGMGQASPRARRDRQDGRASRRRRKRLRRGKVSGGVRLSPADSDSEEVGSRSEDDEDGESREDCTGGEKSGMLISDPTERKNDVDEIYEHACQTGTRQGYIQYPSSSSSRGFTGRVRLLSGENVEATPQPQLPESIVHNVTFWLDGFSVDDGPLRRFDDPANASFLESIKKSECPEELMSSDRQSSVHVNFLRKRKRCPKPVQCQGPFIGIGRTLGSGSSDDAKPEPPSIPDAAESTSRVSSSVGLAVDESLPSTSIQLRLADGTRMVRRFNTHHTVGDIHAFIDASLSGVTTGYQLQAVDFPPRQLSDLSQTIQQANLANSVIIQRLRS